MVKHVRHVLAGLSLFAVVACSEGTMEPETQVSVGIIELGNSSLSIGVPDSVGVEEPFRVTVRTYVSSCGQGESTQVAVNGLVALVVPLDRIEVGGLCANIARAVEHAATVVFYKTGQATVIVQGYSANVDDLITVERTITVQ